MRAQLSRFVGDWQGSYRLWVTPDDPVRESETSASIGLAAGDGFASIRYTWADGEEPQDGLLIVRSAAEPSAEDMVWVDSWHTGGRFMHFRGEPDEEGRIVAFGTYAAPPGPDWGWRIVLAAETTDELRILMYNISPEGEEALAVESRYVRSPA